MTVEKMVKERLIREAATDPLVIKTLSSKYSRPLRKKAQGDVQRQVFHRGGGGGGTGGQGAQSDRADKGSCLRYDHEVKHAIPGR